MSSEKTAASKYDLTEGPLIKTLLFYAVPILISSLIQYLYNVFDTAMVGKWLGTAQMGAVNASGTVCGLLFSLANGFAIGVSVIVGVNYGAKNKQETLRAIVTAEKLSVCAGALFMVLGLSCCNLLIKVTQVPDYQVGYARTYMMIVMGGALISMLNNMHTNLLRTLGDSRSPVVMLVASAAINVGLNLLFMLAFHWGVAGVAIATLLSQLTSASLALVFLLKNYPEFNFFKVKAEKGETNLWLAEIKMGVPMAFQQSMIMIGAVIVQTKVNALDFNSDYAVSNSINNISSNVINTFGSVASGFVAQNFGAKQPKRIKRGILSILVISWMISAILAAVLLVFTRQIVSLFLDEWSEELFRNVQTFIRINVCFYIIWVPVPVLRCSIQSFKNSLVPFLSCLVELPMRCVTAWVLGERFGFLGLSCATPCALVAAFAFLIVAFFIEWRKKITKNPQMQTAAGLSA